MIVNHKKKQVHNMNSVEKMQTKYKIRCQLTSYDKLVKFMLYYYCVLNVKMQ